MAEPYLRQSPLAHLQLLAAGEAPQAAEVVMREHAHRTMVTLRGDGDDEVGLHVAGVAYLARDVADPLRGLPGVDPSEGAGGADG